MATKTKLSADAPQGRSGEAKPAMTPATDRRVTAEHEAAHAVAAKALGLTVHRINIDTSPARCDIDDGTPQQQAIIGAAGDVWITELSGLVLDHYEDSDSDWDRVIAAVGQDRLPAIRAESMRILAARAGLVRSLADELERHGDVRLDRNRRRRLDPENS